MSEIKIEVGQIWEVTTDNFLTSGKNNEYKRPMQLKKGEKIEIRYPFEWHFRTEDNHYFHCTVQMLLENCTIYGKILERIRFSNIAKLEEILRLRLYDKINHKKIDK